MVPSVHPERQAAIQRVLVKRSAARHSEKPSKNLVVALAQQLFAKHAGTRPTPGRPIVQPGQPQPPAAPFTRDATTRNLERWMN